MEAIVLAGGLGTRLRSVVSDLPKPMAPVGERPFLAFLLDRLAMQGCRRVCLSVGYKAESIIDYFGSSYAGMAVHYVREDEPLGTGGGLRLALAALEGPRAWVLNGDTYLDVDLQALLQSHCAAGKAATLVLRRIERADRYGIVVVEDSTVTGFKPAGSGAAALINCGTYVLERSVFDGFDLPRIFSFERDFLEPHVATIRPNAFVTDGLFVDIGIPEDYAWACRNLPAVPGRK